MNATAIPAQRLRLHEDVVATLIGLSIVLLALAVTSLARPADEPASRARWPKGWPTPLAATIDKPQTWDSSPLEAIRDKQGRNIALPIVLGMGWVLLVAVGGAVLGGQSAAQLLPGSAAGESLGKEAGEVAATVKMIQNSMIGVIAFAVAVYWAGWVDREAGPRQGSLLAEAGRRFPRFIAGFLLASLVCSWLFSLSPVNALWIDGTTTGFTSRLRGWLFCAGFVCMGLQTNFRELTPVLASGRPLVLYVGGQLLNLVLTLAMASVTFGWLFRKAVEP